MAIIHKIPTLPILKMPYTYMAYGIQNPLKNPILAYSWHIACHMPNNAVMCHKYAK